MSQSSHSPIGAAPDYYFFSVFMSPRTVHTPPAMNKKRTLFETPAPIILPARDPKVPYSLNPSTSRTIPTTRMTMPMVLFFIASPLFLLFFTPEHTKSIADVDECQGTFAPAA